MINITTNFLLEQQANLASNAYTIGEHASIGCLTSCDANAFILSSIFIDLLRLQSCSTITCIKDKQVCEIGNFLKLNNNSNG
jgi:hypothetical protein